MALPLDSMEILKLQGWWNPESLLTPWGHMAEKHTFLYATVFVESSSNGKQYLL